jgi:hypothetical protein
VGDADRVPVAGQSRGHAHAHLPEEFRVISHGGEIQGPLNLDLAQWLVVVIVRLDPHARTPGKRIGLRRFVSRVLGTCVEGPCCMNMGIAEKRPALGREIRAGFAHLGHRIGPCRGGLRAIGQAATAWHCCLAADAGAEPD